MKEVFFIFNINSIKGKKRRGFTLVELVAVMAIIGILAAALAPKAIGYIDEGKKTKALAEAREIILAVETSNIYGKLSGIDDASKYSEFKSDLQKSNYVDTDKVSSIPDSITLGDLKGIVNEGVSFELEDGKIKMETPEE